jgi:ectoine hydroxylase-related dioxygenase (phytanoyl-CoA dioxygenase family)
MEAICREEVNMSGVSAQDKQSFNQNGFILIRNVFSQEEVAFYLDHYMRMRESGNVPGDTHIANPSINDPLLRYPRMLQMHRWDEVSLRWLLDARLNACLTELLGREPYAVQTMIYFKPPGARGQALHQDNYYLRAQPGTCVAAWMALDRCDELNGCLQVVPGSHRWPILCTVPADTTRSFSEVTVPIPEGTPVLPVRMEPGDVLFFLGGLVHGSLPNTTHDRFRRSLIAHYIEGDSLKVARWYKPTLRMDGSAVEIDASEKGGACGTWVDNDEAGRPAIEITGYEVVEKATE